MGLTGAAASPTLSLSPPAVGPTPRPSSGPGTPAALPRQRPRSRGHNARYRRAPEVFTGLNLLQEWQQAGWQHYHAAASAHHQKYKPRSAREIIFTWWQTPWGTRLPVSRSASPGISRYLTGLPSEPLSLQHFTCTVTPTGLRYRPNTACTGLGSQQETSNCRNLHTAKQPQR